jgi:hypothetical protein
MINFQNTPVVEVKPSETECDYLPPYEGHVSDSDLHSYCSQHLRDIVRKFRCFYELLILRIVCQYVLECLWNGNGEDTILASF